MKRVKDGRAVCKEYAEFLRQVKRFFFVGGRLFADCLQGVMGGRIRGVSENIQGRIKMHVVIPALPD